MGRGKRQAGVVAPSTKAPVKRAKSAAKPKAASATATPPVTPATPEAVYPLPPWPRDQWATKRHATPSQIRDEDALLGFAMTYGLARDFSNAADKGVTAIVSGDSFCNAMGTSLWGDDEHQEHTVYLLVDGKPTAEMNLANLCTWASKDYRGENRKASHASTTDNDIVWMITDAEDLAAFADAEKLRKDWHEPDEQDVGARIKGHYLERRGEGPLIVELCRTKWDDEKSDNVPDFAMAHVYLADLMAWACGSKWSTKIEAGPRLRPSALANRLS